MLAHAESYISLVFYSLLIFSSPYYSEVVFLNQRWGCNRNDNNDVCWIEWIILSYWNQVLWNVGFSFNLCKLGWKSEFKYLLCFSCSPHICPHALSVELEMKCGAAFKSQDWRADVSPLCLLQVCCMTLRKAFSFFPSKDNICYLLFR